MLKRLILFITIPLFFLQYNPGKKDNDMQEWISLFNGKDFKDWTIKITGHDLNDNFNNTFHVENGILKVSYDRYDKFNGEFGHIFYKDKFSDYRIRIEYRFTDEQINGAHDWGLLNSGVMIHSQSPESMGKEQNFPVSIEAQFLGDDGSGSRTTGNVCTPGTHIVMNGKLITEHCTITSKKVCPRNEWVTMEVEVHGDSSIKHYVNGELVSQYEKPQLDTTDTDAQKLVLNGSLVLHEGYIALQAESHPIEFRKVEILLLK